MAIYGTTSYGQAQYGAASSLTGCVAVVALVVLASWLARRGRA